MLRRVISGGGGHCGVMTMGTRPGTGVGVGPGTAVGVTTMMGLYITATVAGAGLSSRKGGKNESEDDFELHIALFGILGMFDWSLTWVCLTGFCLTEMDRL